ncbi:MAG: hypothetical protein QME74_03295, partial [Candidatus Edwardsbacteria bacterium]|nr:hypothetical protein [Candidatus Edwardsbacteria bacterium]
TPLNSYTNLVLAFISVYSWIKYSMSAKADIEFVLLVIKHQGTKLALSGDEGSQISEIDLKHSLCSLCLVSLLLLR